MKELLLKKYNLGTDLTKYFYKSSEIDDVYGIHYEEYNSSLFEEDNLGIKALVTEEFITLEQMDQPKFSRKYKNYSIRI